MSTFKLLKIGTIYKQMFNSHLVSFISICVAVVPDAAGTHVRL